MTAIEATKFIKTLKKNHPVAEDVTIALSLCPGLSRAGKKLFGTVVNKSGSNLMDMYVDSSRHSTLVYQAIAHEYRHIMQWVNRDITWRGNAEDDANIFGNEVTKKYLGSSLVF